MKKELWQNAFGSAPEAFRNRVDDTLNHLEDHPMKKTHRASLILLAAALSVMILAGAGIASEQLHLFDAMRTANPLVPLDSAQDLVSTHLAQGENEFLRLSVLEGIYDGSGAMLRLRIEPTDPEHYVVLGTMSDPAALDDNYLTETTVEDYDIPVTRVTGRKDGKQIIWVGTPALWLSASESPDAEAMGITPAFNSFADQVLSDGSLEIWASTGILAESPDRLEISASIKGFDESYEPVYGEVSPLTFTLNRESETRSVTLTPVSGQAERFELLSASIQFTDVRGYLTARYAYTPTQDEPMGVTLRLLDADGNPIATGSGENEPLDDGTFELRMETQTFAELPETLTLEVKVIGEDKILGSISCVGEPDGQPSASAD